jgi:hypothetical protein
MTKLKPCPFCGSDIRNTVTGLAIDDRYCVCEGNNKHATLVMPIREWNTRPLEDEQSKLIEMLADAASISDKCGYSLDNTDWTEAAKAYREWKDKHAT